MNPLTPPKTPTRRFQRFPHFDEYRTRLSQDFVDGAIICPARKPDGSPTGKCLPLQARQIALAKELLRNEDAFQTAKLWNIVTCLFCEYHQAENRSYYWRDLVDKQWRQDIPEFTLGGSRGRPLWSPRRTPTRCPNTVTKQPASPPVAVTALATTHTELTSTEARQVGLLQRLSAVPTATSLSQAIPTSSPEQSLPSVRSEIATATVSTAPASPTRSVRTFTETNSFHIASIIPSVALVGPRMPTSPPETPTPSMRDAFTSLSITPTSPTWFPEPSTHETPISSTQLDTTTRRDITSTSSTMSPQTPTPSMVLDSATAMFNDTRAIQWSPGDLANTTHMEIRQNIRQLLFKPLTPDCGSIYAFEDSESRTVKIGRTMGDWRTRRTSIERQQDCTFTNSWTLPGIPSAQLRTLETLVHGDLAHYQRYRTVQPRNGRTRRSTRHREWFSIDLATAKRTIDLWWQVMQRFEIEPGRPMSEDLSRLLRSGSMFDIDTDDPEDHNQTLERWKELLLTPDHRMCSHSTPDGPCASQPGDLWHHVRSLAGVLVPPFRAMLGLLSGQKLVTYTLWLSRIWFSLLLPR